MNRKEKKLSIYFIIIGIIAASAFLIFYFWPVFYCETFHSNNIFTFSKPGEEKGKCYYSFAFATNNPVLCDRIPEEAYFIEPEFRARSQCFESFALKRNDSSFCNRIKDFWKQLCLLNFKNDPSLCEEIDDSSKRDYCYLLYVNQVNVIEKRLEGCDKIENYAFHDFCFSSEIKHSNGSLQVEEICNKMKMIFNKYRCLSPMFLANKQNGSVNSSIYCNRFNDSMRQVCLLVLTEDASFCEEINESEERDFCYRFYAETNGTVETKLNVCNKIKDISQRDTCYMIVTDFVDNISEAENICSLKVGEKRKDACYTIITDYADNISEAESICNSKVSEGQKDTCLSIVRSKADFNESAI